MESTYIILGVILALLLGSLITWLLIRNRFNNSSEGSEELASQLLDLEAKLQANLKQQDENAVEKSNLETKINKLEGQLEAKSSEVKTLSLQVQELTTLSPDSKDYHIVESLKKDLKKKDSELEEQEEEIEDLEDELSSVKKKLRSSKSEVEELTAKIEQADKAAKDLKLEIADKTEELKEVKEEEKVKAEALEFVNGVLQAKDADDRDVKVINDKVGIIESIIFDQYLPLEKEYSKGDEVTEEFIKNVHSTVLHWANLQRKSWLNNKKVIAFIGEFSAGKTSIVNRILSQDDPNCPKLPVSSKATTAIATYISYGAGFHSQFTDANGNLKNLPLEMFTKVNKDILSKVNVAPIIQYFVMKYNNENLKGLSILDTPGFSSNDEQDKERTLAVINESDALFWVVDANSGEINRSSLKIISENVVNIPLYVIINKADTKSPGELDQLERHLRETMNKAEIKVVDFVRFSQKAPLDNLMDVIAALPEARGGLGIAQICSFIQGEINILQKCLTSQKKVLRDDESVLANRKEILNEALYEVVESSERISELPKKNSKWFTKDDYRLDEEEYIELINLCEYATNISNQAQECFFEYSDIYSEYHNHTEEYRETKEQLQAIQNVQRLLNNALRNLDPKLYAEIQSLVKEELAKEN